MGAEAMPIARPRASRGLVVTSRGAASDVVLRMIGSYHSISAAVSGRALGWVPNLVGADLQVGPGGRRSSARQVECELILLTCDEPST